MFSAFPRLLALALLACSTATNARELRVCADPNNRPFSAQDGSGMENKISEVIAQELGAKVT
jgi:mxaJ protein